MTKKKQSKRSGKQAAKKTVNRPDIDATLHELPAIEPPSSPANAHLLSAPEPLVPQAESTDIATVQQTSAGSSIQDIPSTASQSDTPSVPVQSPMAEMPSSSDSSLSMPSLPTLDRISDPSPTPFVAIPAPATDAPTPAAPVPGAGEHQVTTYDIPALHSPTNPPVPDIAPMVNQPLGSLTRSTYSSDLSRSLPVKEDPAYKWRAPIDYFGASAAAFSSSFSGTSGTSGERDLNTIKKPSAELPASSSPNGLSVFSSRSSASPSVEQPPSTTLEPALNYNPAIQLEPQTPGLSPKMAKFVASLRERELAASGSSPTLQQQTEATAVDIAPVNSPALPPVTSPLTSPTEPAQSPAMQTPAPVKTEPKQPTSGSVKSLNQTVRDLTPSQVSKSSQPAEPKEASALEVTPKPYDQDEEAPSPKMAAFVADLRESIISQDKPEDWHPVTQKKPRATNDAFSSGLEELQKSPSDAPPKPKQPEPERHYSLEELAAMDPELALPTPTVHQQSIRRLKSKTTAGVRFEIYLLIYFICLGLSWVTEQSAAAGTCRDAGQRIESAVQLIAPKPLADNFIQGVNTYDDREIKLHPFNPNKRPNLLQVVIHRIFAFCSGLSAAFGRIPGTVFVSSAANPLAPIMVLLTYVSIGILSLLIYFKFRRSMAYGVTDLLIVPICLIAAASGISAIFAAVLSTSASLAAIYLPNTIVLFTTVTVVLSVLDMARRSFVGRKQAIMRD